MKTYRRFIAMLLAGVLFLSCVPAHAMTTTEKENNYNAAILQLETYLESAGNSSAELAGIRAVFDALGGYEQSRFLSYYTSVLMKIADEEYDYELYMFLDMLERNQSFNAYLKETLKGSSIGSVEELQAYTHGREYEHDGANSEAIACYVECLNYFDASGRYFSLQQDKDQAIYNEAAAMLSRGDLAGAYFKFSEILRYKDSKDRRDSIVSLLGYTPSSPTDNLEAVMGLTVAEIKNTEITISWQKSHHASCYYVYYKPHSSNEWTSEGTVSETKKRITGLKAGTAYDFQVIAISGQAKAKEALLNNVKTTNVTPTPIVTPTPTPKPTPTPTPKPGEIGSIITFGHYEQDNNISNGKESIEWIVISSDKQNGRLLLLSRYALVTREYYNVYTDTSWSNCNLRSWLNKEFYTNTFTSSEQQYILTSTINNSLSEQYTMPYDKTTNDNNTTDKVFLLSYNEAFNIYFLSDAERQCKATDFALSNGVWTTTQGEYVGNCVWILRCKGTGFIDSVDLDGTRDSQRVDMVGAGIRPALWVKNNIIH